MAKDKVVRRMTEEHWERIKNTPGVVIRQRPAHEKLSFFKPRIRPSEKLDVTASELINDDDDWSDEAWSR